MHHRRSADCADYVCGLFVCADCVCLRGMCVRTDGVCADCADCVRIVSACVRVRIVRVWMVYGLCITLTMLAPPRGAMHSHAYQS